MTTPQPIAFNGTDPGAFALTDNDGFSLRMDDHGDFVCVKVLDPQEDFDAVDLNREQAAAVVAALQGWIDRADGSVEG